jgi:orotate phosphoribosyltransferase-like protein
MTKYHEILRLKSLGLSERNIARSCNVSRNTVSKILKIATRKGISWPLNESMTEDVLKSILFE